MSSTLALVTIIGLAVIISTNSFPLTLPAFYIVRVGDTIVFKRAWLYSVMSRAKASMSSALISPIRRVILIIKPVYDKSIS